MNAWVVAYLVVGLIVAAYVAWEATNTKTVDEVRSNSDYDLSDKALAFGQTTAVLLLGAFWPVFLFGAVWMAVRGRK